MSINPNITIADAKKYIGRYIVGLVWGSFLAGFIAYVPYTLGSAIAEIFDPSISIEPGFYGTLSATWKLMESNLMWFVGGFFVGVFVVAVFLIPSVYVTRHKPIREIIRTLSISTMMVAFCPAIIASFALIFSLLLPQQWFAFFLSDLWAGVILGWPLIGAPIGFIAGHYFLLR